MTKKVILSLAEQLAAELEKKNLSKRGFKNQSEYVSHLIREDQKRYASIGQVSSPDVMGT